jgi:hypothetical protein
MVDDELIGLDNNKFEWYDEFQGYLAAHKGRPVMMNMLRNGQRSRLR